MRAKYKPVSFIQLKFGLIISLFGGVTMGVIQTCSNNEAKEQDIAASFPKYNNVMEMLDSAGDYTSGSGTVKMVTDTPLHIEVSSFVIPTETNEVIKSIAKRDIVYVALQSFAQTPIDEIRLTSLPIQVKEGTSKKQQPLNYLKKVMYVNRKTATEILQRYTQLSEFKDLYELNGTRFVPNSNFNKLLHSDLENVFADMLSRCKCGSGYIEPYNP